MKMSENKVPCHIGQVSCMNLEFSIARKLFHLSRAIGQAGRCTTDHMFRCEVSVYDQSACIHIRQSIYNVFTMCGFKESRFEPTNVGHFLYTFFTTVGFFFHQATHLFNQSRLHIHNCPS